MTPRRHVRSMLALVAAYAIALQAVLSAFGLAARAGEAVFLSPDRLCVQDRSHPNHAPLDRMPCCVSSACCHMAGSGEPATLPQGEALPSPRDSSSVIRVAAWTMAPRLAPEGAQHPRAPPVA